MTLLIAGLLALALVAIAVAFVLSNQFVAKIEAWRKIVIAAQTSASPDQDRISVIWQMVPAYLLTLSLALALVARKPRFSPRVCRADPDQQGFGRCWTWLGRVGVRDFGHHAAGVSGFRLPAARRILRHRYRDLPLDRRRAPGDIRRRSGRSPRTDGADLVSCQRRGVLAARALYGGCRCRHRSFRGCPATA